MTVPTGFSKQWPGGGLRYPGRIVGSNPGVYTPQDGDPLFLDNIQTAIAVASQTGGMLSNTGYRIESGTWSVIATATGQYIECIVAGILSRRALSAFGTWDLEIQKADASDTYTLFVASEVGSDGSGSQDSYMVRLLTNERVGLRENLNGAGSYLFFTDADEVTPAMRYKYRVTRSDPAGVFTAYSSLVSSGVPLALIGNIASGSNPATDTSTITSLYCLHDFDAEDRLYADKHFQGIIAA